MGTGVSFSTILSTLADTPFDSPPWLCPMKVEMDMHLSAFVPAAEVQVVFELVKKCDVPTANRLFHSLVFEMDAKKFESSYSAYMTQLVSIEATEMLGGGIIQKEENCWKVLSMSRKDVVYEVVFEDLCHGNDEVRKNNIGSNQFVYIHAVEVSRIFRDCTYHAQI
ncbi:hypothetical protein ANCCAN_23224 [Ancylostoma caninum]|uniref:Uncharacterized protein n=1 Tax=Ancylostoma caninum TaxID=29170 RepID=A0A368FJG8_ANCCA|nr:hypothetical protein ANCCAN_23224 [Ancylostoma caninum]